ncbi:MAG: NAD(P)-dependent oxidoreductase [Candidatus Obscuribacterales bacterium]|nr:NAD(P)-dependent oxidoreductase [Candidatus Obscuribacterales bacterium]
MKILVTGATGCLGSAVANHLSAKGNAVTGTGRNLDLAKHLSPGITFVAAELSDEKTVANLVQEHDSIVHCAGLSTLWGSYRDFQVANVEATANLLNAALNNKIENFVFISTPSLYFDFKNRLNIKEDDPLTHKLVNSYAMSKLACEQLVKDAQNKGLASVVLRPRAIFGPNDRALMPRLLRLANKGWLPLIDNGKAQIDLTYVDNVAHAVALALENLPDVSGKIYNISNGEPITVSSLFNKIISEFHLNARCISIPYDLAYAAALAMEALASRAPGCPEPLLTKYTVGVIGRSQTLSIEAASRDLNYKPIVSLEDGIRHTASCFNSGNRVQNIGISNVRKVQKVQEIDQPVQNNA